MAEEEDDEVCFMDGFTCCVVCKPVMYYHYTTNPLGLILKKVGEWEILPIDKAVGLR